MSTTPIGPASGYQRIATEEAYAPPELFERFRKMLETKSFDDPAFNSLWGFYLLSPSERAKQVIRRLQDLGEARIADMDATGIDKQLLLLTAPGVQVFDAATATSLATSFNDQLAETIRGRPTRYAGLAAIAPQDAAGAARELERAVKTLGLKGAVINSHTQGEFLDDPKYWEIFAAAESLDVPIYLHPTGPPKSLIQPFLEAGLDGAVFGFGVETGLHMLRIIVSGVFDRFPQLRMVIGHMGEALPFWLYRMDYMHGATVASQRYPSLKPLKKKISDYMRENVYVTNSGVAWEPAIKFSQEVLGVDRVMYAMDYPYQFVADEVRVADGLRISDADKKKFFQTNAERVFKL